MALNANSKEKAIAQGSGIYTWVIATDTFFTDDFAAEIFGFNHEVARKGLSIKEYLARIHQDDLPRVAQAIQDALASGMPCNEQYRIRRPDGSICEIMGFGSCFRDSSGKPTHYSGILFPTAAPSSSEDAIVTHLVAAHDLARRKGWTRLAEKIVDSLVEVGLEEEDEEVGRIELAVKELH